MRFQLFTFLFLGITISAFAQKKNASSLTNKNIVPLKDMIWKALEETRRDAAPTKRQGLGEEEGNEEWPS